MSDNATLVQCPSCGHENAAYVDKCIICDFSLVVYRNQLRSRNAAEAKALENDESLAQAGKRLGPLPDSDMLADKKKTKARTGKIAQCLDCGQAYRVGAFVCQNCGVRLPQDSDEIADQFIDSAVDDETNESLPYIPDDEQTQSVPELDKSINHPMETPAIVVPLLLDEPAHRIPDQCFKFASWMILRFDVEGYDTPIVIRPLPDKPMLIGRRHESLPVQPHIDLTAYLMNKHGVSRRHALLRLRGTRLELQDLASTNGTSINGVRFSPKEVHQLRHQDIIMIGQIKLRLTFVQRARSASNGNTEELI
jgi:DNA-directed RNA polymerase subunit M/transcription elongation factor TFIIS